MPSCTKGGWRRRRSQVSPLLRYLAIIAPSTAASNSASSKTMMARCRPALGSSICCRRRPGASDVSDAHRAGKGFRCGTVWNHTLSRQQPFVTGAAKAQVEPIAEVPNFRCVRSRSSDRRCVSIVRAVPQRSSRHSCEPQRACNARGGGCGPCHRAKARRMRDSSHPIQSSREKKPRSRD